MLSGKRLYHTAVDGEGGAGCGGGVGGEEDDGVSDVAAGDAGFEQVSAAVDGLTSLIEPIVIAFLGIVIGAIVIAMFLPILTITQHIS